MKGEFILEGGTYGSYPYPYRKWFVNRLYYACNTIYDSLPRRDIRPLAEEIEINRRITGIRVVGLSVETRPDFVTDEFVRECRAFGVTKVQLGVQHTDDTIMKKLNRKCTSADVKRGMKKLLENGFKIQIHLMPDLPGSSPERDVEMFQEIFSNPEYGFDHVKIYPCMVLPYTMIEKWYSSGKYVPYADTPSVLLRVMVRAIELLRENGRFDIRIERIVRDMPIKDVIGGCKQLNMGDLLAKTCTEKNACICIRCREIGDRVEREWVLETRSRIMCGSEELFISIETPDRSRIFGFARLRLPSEVDTPLFGELLKATIIREVHVYGSVAHVGAEKSNAQHRGFGSVLVDECKRVSIARGFSKIAVISGVGVSEYYVNKHGFVNGDVNGGSYYVCELGSPRKNES